MTRKHTPSFDRVAYLFQGGGALGSYQVGVFEGLSPHYPPSWMIGTSMGAINSAIIVGNTAQKRMKKLRQFWDTIATKMPPPPESLNNIYFERWHNMLSSQYTLYAGQPGFFKPRDYNPWLGVESTADKLSYYDTSELRETLLKCIDFERINDPTVRLSLGAVRIATGELVYFDNTKITITPEHIMASGALPPGFPAVKIDDQFYWDAGVHSNTQLNLLLCEREPIHYLCFMVQLFDSFGMRPTTMDDVLKRQKDITYSSHHTQFIQVYRVIHNLRNAIRILGKHLKEEAKEDPEIIKLLDQGRTGTIHVASFSCKAKQSELSSKDFDFSTSSIEQHIKDGCDQVHRAMRQPPWLEPYPEDVGLLLYEFAKKTETTNTPFEQVTTYHRVES